MGEDGFPIEKPSSPIPILPERSPSLKAFVWSPVYGSSLISCYTKWLPFYLGLSYMWLLYLHNTVKIKTLRRGLLGKDTVFAVDALGVDAFGKGHLVGALPEITVLAPIQGFFQHGVMPPPTMP